MTVRELTARMDSRELSEWMAYARLEPWGELRDDLRIGQVCATLANINRTKRSGRVFKPEDFMGYLAREVRRDDPHRVSRELRAAFSRHNARIKAST